jgi:GGDEF domain-containing protein
MPTPTRFIVRVNQASFYDTTSGLLTREAFGFMLDHHLKQSQRAQEFLTLVIFVAERECREMIIAADEWVVNEIARLIRCAVRSTDLLARSADGMVSLLLIGIDLERARGVIDRINHHLRRYLPSPAFRISVGAACCPTHAIGAEDLLRQARALTIQSYGECDSAI